MMNAKLSILVVCGTFPPDIGGSELSIHTACKGLIQRGHSLLVIADDRRPTQYYIEGVPVIGVPPDRVKLEMDRLHSVYEFDVVITQLIYSPEALRWGNQNDVATIYFVRNSEMHIDLSKSSPYYPTILVANSQFILSRTIKRWKRKPEVIYPFIDLEKFIPVKKEPVYITMINPLVIKGGKLFYSLAEYFPERKFLAVRGWTGLRNREDFDWNSRQWELIAKAHNDESTHPPEEVDFTGLDNVTTLKGVEDMKSVYGITRILLFPSQWEEAFGRSVVEALGSGIPVIASNIGGVKETGIENGGILIAKNSPLETWIKAIEKLDDLVLYNSMADSALEDASKYSLEEQIEKLEYLCFRANIIRIKK